MPTPPFGPEEWGKHIIISTHKNRDAEAYEKMQRIMNMPGMMTNTNDDKYIYGIDPGKIEEDILVKPQAILDCVEKMVRYEASKQEKRYQYLQTQIENLYQSSCKEIHDLKMQLSDTNAVISILHKEIESLKAVINIGTNLTPGRAKLEQ